MKRLDDFRLKFGNSEYVPIMIGGMGVDISTSELALVAAKLGGIGHISDAMIPTVSDRRFQTQFVKNKLKKYKANVKSSDKSSVKFDIQDIAEATRLHVEEVMAAKQGPGLIFTNCMEKLGMNNPRETLRTRLRSTMDAGIDGITLSAGLHLGSFELMQDMPRFRDVKLGIIVSSVRALKLFLKRAVKVDRMPDYVVVEGPLAGGHLGFGPDWAEYDLKAIVQEVMDYLKEEELDVPVLPAGGIFTGTDAVEYMEMGAHAVQVATRFTITKECGLPDKVKQEYLKANEEDIEVNMVSPTGYPMRMLKSSPAIGANIRPNCEAFGYLLDRNGHCSYVEAYNRELEQHPDGDFKISDKTCLCTHMRKFQCWTCGHYTYRLKDTTIKNEDGSYVLPDAEHVFKDYQFSTDHQVMLPTAD